MPEAPAPTPSTVVIPPPIHQSWLTAEAQTVKEIFEPTTSQVKVSLAKTVTYLQDCQDRNKRKIEASQKKLSDHKTQAAAVETSIQKDIATYQAEIDNATILLSQIQPIVYPPVPVGTVNGVPVTMVNGVAIPMTGTGA